MYEIINKLEELYSNNLVYRTIIVCDDIDKYNNILNKHNYDAYILKEYYTSTDYDSLDVRIFLIEKALFTRFINAYMLDNKNMEYNCRRRFYNSIIIQLDNDVIRETERIKRDYSEALNNNYNDDIII
jgi:hypothetical protein